MEPIERYRGCLLGLAIGAPWGQPSSSARRDPSRPSPTWWGGGPFHLQPGEWTDDTGRERGLRSRVMILIVRRDQPKLGARARARAGGVESSVSGRRRIGPAPPPRGAGEGADGGNQATHVLTRPPLLRGPERRRMLLAAREFDVEALARDANNANKKRLVRLPLSRPRSGWTTYGGQVRPSARP